MTVPKSKTSLILAAGLAIAALPLSMSAGSGKGHDLKSMDTNNDGKVSRMEYSTASAEKFAKLDADGDGQVGVPELTAAFARADDMKSDRTGTAATPATPAKPPSSVTMPTYPVSPDKGANEHASVKEESNDTVSPAQFVTQYDADNDAQVSKAEYAAASDKRFTKLDTNKDDSLSQEELEAGMKAKMKHTG